MKLVLDLTDAGPSAAFSSSGGVSYAFCDTHTGGTWTLQIESPGGNWIDMEGDGGVEFTDTGLLGFRLHQGASIRFNGGTTGARIYASNVS